MKPIAFGRCQGTFNTSKMSIMAKTYVIDVRLVVRSQQPLTS